MLKEIDIPPLWLAISAAIIWCLGTIVPVEISFGRPVGWVIILLGVGLLVGAMAQMAAQRTSFIPRRNPTALVTGGLFALSRNPIYLGDALILTGLCLIWDAPHGLLLVPIFIWLITQRYILAEEAQIRQAFGSEFDSYCTQTRRWL
ncbi:hypothetical protein BFP70_10860 [Thioclava sp. SK-1]|uniref:methyltransferase family protein n=1 Tax=Thioclava sp. SK-1 TaxID=1889770 RepID=UPI000824D223|nr:isoprenylcysteine carboxylmethyltransferase family protein [Thioclava sp. SK-1]OCX64531.1 hypothetical protein BFP70_10860 [Thioclava sp. SK-1]